MKSDKTITGGCQCGYIQYEIIGEPLTLYACHCADCQKQSSSAFGMSLWVRPEDFALLSGKLKTWITKGESGNEKICTFCGECGSRIYHQSNDASAALSIKAGTIKHTRQLKPLAHIWTKSAQPWFNQLLDAAEPDTIICYQAEPDDTVLLRLWQEANLTLTA